MDLPSWEWINSAQKAHESSALENSTSSWHPPGCSFIADFLVLTCLISLSCSFIFAHLPFCPEYSVFWSTAYQSFIIFHQGDDVLYCLEGFKRLFSSPVGFSLNSGQKASHSNFYIFKNLSNFQQNFLLYVFPRRCENQLGQLKI